MRMNPNITGIGLTDIGNHLQAGGRPAGKYLWRPAAQGAPGERQVENAHLGLAHNAGRSLTTDTAATVVTLLQREELN